MMKNNATLFPLPHIIMSLPPQSDGAIQGAPQWAQFNTANLDPGFYDTNPPESITPHRRHNNGATSIKRGSLARVYAVTLISGCHSLSVSGLPAHNTPHS